MALRTVLYENAEVLNKRCREVGEINDKIKTILDDMKETMIFNEGVGIAAPQIGLLKRMCIVCPTEDEMIELINPIILATQGEQEDYEGCLSLPGHIGLVKRPEYIKVRAMNRDGEEKTYEFTGFGARVVSHELDHLDGILYNSKAIEMERLEDFQETALEVIDEQMEAGTFV